MTDTNLEAQDMDQRLRQMIVDAALKPDTVIETFEVERDDMRGATTVSFTLRVRD